MLLGTVAAIIRNGFAAAIETEFGKVLDYSFYDRVCFSCSRWPESRRTSYTEEFLEFCDSRKDHCSANYKVTSQSMESSGAVDVWSRSFEEHSLACGTYIGDGDSSSFKNLFEPYCPDPQGGMNRPCTEEIEEAANEEGKTLHFSFTRQGGIIAHLYALVVVEQRGKYASEIHYGLQVLLTHTKEVHDGCPPGDTSWCYYQTRQAKYVIDGGAAPPTTRNPYLTPSEY